MTDADSIALECSPTYVAGDVGFANCYDSSDLTLRPSGDIKSRLLDLPIELRLMILELALHGGRFRRDVDGHWTTTDRNATQSLASHINSVVLVCKQFYIEGSPLVICRAHFHFDIGRLGVDLIGPVERHYPGAMRQITFQLCATSTTWRREADGGWKVEPKKGAQGLIDSSGPWD